MSSIAKKFAINIKKLRIEKGLTQKQLAKLLCCSEKAVSKWECATSVPDIEVLLSISKILQVNMDSLFADENNVYFLGIDGGGTKTKLLLTDSDGKVINSVCADSCNPIDIGAEKSKEILQNAIYEVCDGIPFSSIVVFAGIAGGTTAGMKEVFHKFFEQFHFKMSVNDTDNKNIIAAGLGESNGIALIMGTGICSYLQNNGEYTQAGGRGYLIDNGGSAFNIGRDGLHAYFAEKDGIGPETRITAEIDKLDSLDVHELMKKIYSGNSKKVIASYSFAVYQAAKDGDEVAICILKRNMQEAAKLVETLAGKLDSKKIPVVLAGGLIKEEMTVEYLKEALKNPEKYDIKILDKEPVLGAVLLARKMEGKC